MSSLREPKRLKSFLTKSHARAPVQEKEIAKRLGGERVSGSGCGRIKGDVRVKGILRVEAKTTKNESFRVTTEMLEKIEQAAITEGEVPAMVIEMRGRSLAILPVYALEMLAGSKELWRV